MPTYLVERYLPGCHRVWIGAAVGLHRRQQHAAHIGSTYVAVDDACLCRFEAETADDVREADGIADVPFARIVAAEEIGIGHSEPAKKGNPS